MATSQFKGGGGSHNQSHSQRGKPYALMLILAFGAAILGVMVLHKLRERRIFATIVKQKDQELFTLHLLLQREQEFNKEARNKIEEMKTKVFSLRSQKLELDRRISEMESTISTMGDERKVIESALEEKKNEIKVLTGGGMNSSTDLISQVDSLKEVIKTKEAEIEDLRHQLQNPITASFTGNSTKDEGSIKTESITWKEKGQVVNGEAREFSDVEGVLTGRDENVGNKTADSKSSQALKVAEKAANETGTTSLDGEISDQGNEGHASFSRKGLMLEKSEGFEHGLGYRGRRQHSKGMRWREGVRNRRLGESLYSVNNEMEAVSKENNENAHKVTESTVAGDEDSKKLELTDKYNQTSEIGGKSEDRKEDEKTVKQKTPDDAVQESDENANPKLVSDGERVRMASVRGYDRKLKSGEMSSRVEDQEPSGKTEEMQTMDFNHHQNDNEQGKSGEKEKVEAEEEENADTQVAEIERADIQRFSESDHEDESEETEF